VAGGLSRGVGAALDRLARAAWEARRRAWAAGLAGAERVGARVVSVGNLTVGGTGKTTLALHLARVARRAGRRAMVVCRRYRPGPGGRGDEELLYAAALGEDAVRAGRVKRDLARRAVAAGADWIVVDDGFSHWRLERDLDIVLLDAGDPWGGGRLLPAGRLREPRRALQRAGAVVVSRLAPGEDPGRLLAEARDAAPAAVFGAGRHRVAGVRRLDGAPAERGGRAVVVTGTGNPAAVARSAAEAGFEVTARLEHPDHHWFTRADVTRALERGRRDGATVLLTAKDAVRWPRDGEAASAAVLEVEWEWVLGGDPIERLALGGEEA
jgi:tetraacyldisaccharide 4'-kinase